MLLVVLLLCLLRNVDTFFWEIDREDWRLNRRERLKVLAAPVDLRRPISHSVGTTEAPRVIDMQLIEATTIAFGRTAEGSAHFFRTPAQDSPTRDKHMIDVYTVRVRWLDPIYWNDGSSEFSSGRFEGEGNNRRWILVNRRLSAEFSGYGEKFQFPPNWDLTFQCAVRAINGLGSAGRWTAAEPVHVLRIPIHLPGLVDIDVRHLSESEINNILSSAVRVSRGRNVL
uniref:Fibronectin type-III domain-containing protein n=1 Tax=Trichuris muris TaxID=70415 RepID=A0A5S6R4M5_TRIMR